VKWVGSFILAALLVIPALRGADPPKEEKDQTPKEQYQALVKEFQAQQRENTAEARKAKGAEQTKALQKNVTLAKEFAEKFFKLAEDNPNDPIATDALFWVMQNGMASPVFKQATDKVTNLIAEMPLEQLATRLNSIRGTQTAVLDAVIKRADKEASDPKAGDLLGWVATNAGMLPAGQKAIVQLIEKHPDHAALERVVSMLGTGRIPKGEELLRKLLSTSSKTDVKAAGTFALGQCLVAKTNKSCDTVEEANKVAAEAEKYLNQAIELFGDNKAAQRKAAEQELQAFQKLRVGKEALEISATDLDEKEFKLSDYRGKVVMLDFWGNW